MKIIIAGDGKVGLALTRQLLHEGHEVTIVDQREDSLRRALDALDAMTVRGNGISVPTLEGANPGTPISMRTKRTPVSPSSWLTILTMSRMVASSRSSMPLAFSFWSTRSRLMILCCMYILILYCFRASFSDSNASLIKKWHK